MGHLIIQVWFGDKPTFIDPYGNLEFLFQISVSYQDGSALPLHRNGAVIDSGVWCCHEHHPREEEPKEGLQDGPQ